MLAQAAEVIAVEANLINTLANLGGLGILGAILFYLHVRQLNIFREELAAERRQCHEDHLKLEQAQERGSEQVRRLAEAVTRLTVTTGQRFNRESET